MPEFPAVAATYAGAGVNIAAGDEAVARLGALVRTTTRPEVLAGIGGFAGLFALDTGRHTRPLLVASTDGVGTKLLVARATNRFATVGIDLVAMCVDDLACSGAEPLFLLDYIAVGAVDPTQIETLVGGIVTGCRTAGCALLGGETAEHPGAMATGDVNLAGFAVGVVDAERVLGPDRVREGDVLIGLSSPGLRSNGYTLARHVLLERAGRPLDGPAWEGAAASLADELLAPSVIYSPAVQAALTVVGEGLHACAHITGGGIPGNLPRALPAHLDARLDRSSWPVPRLFDEIARLGPVAPAEMERVFNLGLGMVLVADPAVADAVMVAAAPALEGTGAEVSVVGDVVAGTGGVRW